MTLTKTMAALQGYLDEHKARQEEIKITLKFLRDFGISIDERWELFINAIPLLPIESDGDGHVDVLDPEGTLYDHFYTERYQTRTYDAMDERIVELIDEINIDTIDPWEQQRSARGEQYKLTYNRWREAVMAAGYGGFVYDW